MKIVDKSIIIRIQTEPLFVVLYIRLIFVNYMLKVTTATNHLDTKLELHYLLFFSIPFILFLYFHIQNQSN